MITFLKQKILQNSLFLIMSRMTMAGFGFLFWFINTRLFTPSEIGLATLLISAMAFISLLSLGGFDTVLIRFLWHSNRRDAKINTAMASAAIVATLLASGFILLIPLVAPKLLFMHKNFWLIGGFIIFCIAATWNVLTDAVFLAYRKTFYTFAINATFSFEKMLLPFVLLPLGTSGIFAAAGLASLTGCCLSIWTMVKKFDYKPRLTIDSQIIGEVKRYSTANYIVDLSYILPQTIIPFIVAGYLGSATAAYFYIDFMIANMLYVIPISASRSLLAEGSHSREHLKKHFKQAVSLTSLLMMPAIVVLVIGAPFILQIFGKNYANDGVGFLRIMAFSGIAVSSFTIIDSVFKVTKQLLPIIVTSVFCVFTVIAGSFIALQFGLGLMGIGWAWLAGNILASLIGLAWLWGKHYR